MVARAISWRLDVAKAECGKYVRSVGGDLVSSVITDTSAIRIEMLRRETAGRMHWHFRQPEMSLFCFNKGAVRLNATVDCRSVNRQFSGKSKLAIFPAAIEIEGEWDVGPTLDYTVIFLNPAFVDPRLQSAITSPIISFEHQGLMRGLAELCREAESPDNVFGLMSEGWAMQALAHISRVSDGVEDRPILYRGDINGRRLKLVDDFIRDNLAKPISIAQLAGIAGLSKRHFLRAFQERVGSSPYGLVQTRRLEEAKRRLAHTTEPITDIALATGFTHAQHFSTRFKKSTGMSPSSFRQRLVA